MRVSALCLLALAAVAIPSAALAKDYQVASSCSASSYSLPYAAQGFLTPATDSEALSTGLVSGGYSGVKPDGMGGVCSGRVFKVTSSGLRLWRVTSNGSLPGALGSWWSFEKSDDKYASRASWRAANAVCKGWNGTADYMVSCPIKKGAYILVGGTQSAQCSKAGAGGSDTYPRSPTTQVSLNARAAIDASMCGAPMKIKRWTDSGK